MSKIFLSFGDPCLKHCINALADLYAKQNNNQIQAVDFCLKQLSVHEKYLSNTNHISIAHIQMKIGELSNDMNWYRKAMMLFENNIHQDYASTANCLMKLAQYCQHHEALLFYSKVNEIYKKISPPNHSLIIANQKQLNKLKKTKIFPTIPSMENILHQSQSTTDGIQQQQEEEQIEFAMNSHIQTQIPVATHQFHSDDQSPIRLNSDIIPTNISVEHFVEGSKKSLSIDPKQQLHNNIEILRQTTKAERNYDYN